jgi:multiple sugar transport system ATP-binding protein
MNLVEADVADGHVEFAGIRVQLEGPAPSGRVILGIRPQDLQLGDGFEVEPAIVEELGSATNVIFPVEAPPVDTEAVRAATDEGDRAVLLHTDQRALFTVALPEGTDVRPGRPITLSVDPARLHYFDPETGLRIDTAR